MCPNFVSSDNQDPNTRAESIDLPKPKNQSHVSIERALWERKSTRKYTDEPISLSEIGQLLWAAQGITRQGYRRPAPSAGATYPLELYLITRESDELQEGLYHYVPSRHHLHCIRSGDFFQALCSAALDQEMITNAAAVIVITAIYARTTDRYHDRGDQFVHMEVGCAAQNIHLQAVSLDLGTVFVGAFEDDNVSDVLGLPHDTIPLCLMPVGRIKNA